MKIAPLRLIVTGAWGRMGTRVAELARKDPRFSIVAGVVKGQAASGSGSMYVLASDLPRELKRADVVIDFSAPEASVGFAEMAAQARKAIVIGTTGFTKAQSDKIRSLGRAAPIFLSPNLSPGVNLMFHLSALAARVLKDYDASISEIHHPKKKDAPSGTALRLAEAVRQGRQSDEAVPIVSQRIGDVVGEHTLTFAGPTERLELTHRAHSRDIFAKGALHAASWVARKKPRIYDMLDLMGLNGGPMPGLRPPR